MSGLTKFSETIERTNSPRKISRVLRRDNSFSSHEPINRHVEEHKHCDDQTHGRQNARFSYRRSKRHGQEPADRRNRGKIGEPIGQTDDVKRAEAQRKSQKRTKLEARAKPRNKNREDLPEKEDAPEEQGHPVRPAFRKEEVRTTVKGKAQSENKNAADKTGKNKTD